MNNNKTIPAEIHATLALGSTSAAPFYDVRINQTLCQCACVDETPVFSPSLSVNSIEAVGTNQYLVSIHVEGVIAYVPCGCGTCSTRTQVISQDFNVPIYSATAITGVTITTGSINNSITRYSCSNCSKGFVSDIPMTLTITTA